MIRKIISIKNVGRFLNYKYSGDVELKRYSLVFAENGRGKTTFCAILRSLQSGMSSHVLGRTTLGTGGEPEIKVLSDDKTISFNSDGWSATVPNLSIFDSTFVSENVYSGDTVELAHRRNLHNVIVGEQGVTLNRLIEQLDDASRKKSTEIREKRAVVQAIVPQELTVEQFLEIQEDPSIDAKIARKETELQAVKKVDQIRERAGLSDLILPALPDGFAELLGKTIEGIAIDAERQVRRQIEAHAMHERGEPWLSEGFDYIGDTTACPFCGQPLDGVDLINAYKAYFSKNYKALQAEIIALHHTIETAFADLEIAKIERTLDQNVAAFEFWSQYCDFTTSAFSEATGIGEILRTLRQTALALLEEKSASPLDRVTIDEVFTAAHGALVVAQTNAASYNLTVNKMNAAIEAKRTATAAADVRIVETALALRKAIKKRHEPITSAVCKEYLDALKEKEEIENKKTRAKEKLDNHTKAVIDRYESTINGLLDVFQAGFRITGTKQGYPGGVASLSYQILINDTAIEIGDSETPINRPSFKNTLSSGDRSTLALAFFLSQIEHDPERANKIVVFDDPFNSQDSFRKDHTVQKIKQCGESCCQVIVLSHDLGFLQRLWKRLAPLTADRKSLQFARIGLNNTKICEWDIELATQNQYVLDCNVLANYHTTGEGNPRDLVTKLRPILETHCRKVSPGEFVGDPLGTIIGKVRAAGVAHQLYPLLDDLDVLNEYTRRYHHGENPYAGQEPFSETEFQGFVKKTLIITGISV
jgi:wobble nucleotide-excising tRNase